MRRVTALLSVAADVLMGADASGTLLASVEAQEMKGGHSRFGNQDVFIACGGEDRLKQGPVVGRVVNDQYAHGNGASA